MARKKKVNYIIEGNIKEDKFLFNFPFEEEK